MTYECDSLIHTSTEKDRVCLRRCEQVSGERSEFFLKKKKQRQQECEREREWARETEKRRERKPKKERCLSLEYTLQLLLNAMEFLIG